MTLTLLANWTWIDAHNCTNRDGSCGLAQSLVCECSNPDQVVIGLSALASLQPVAQITGANSYSETARLARYPLYPLLYSLPAAILAQVFYGLDVIGSTHRPANPRRGLSIA